MSLICASTAALRRGRLQLLEDAAAAGDARADPPASPIALPATEADPPCLPLAGLAMLELLMETRGRSGGSWNWRRLGSAISDGGRDEWAGSAG